MRKNLISSLEFSVFGFFIQNMYLDLMYLFTFFFTSALSCDFFYYSFNLACVCFNQELAQEVSGILRRIWIMKAIIQFSLLQAESPPPSLACPFFNTMNSVLQLDLARNFNNKKLMIRKHIHSLAMSSL